MYNNIHGKHAIHNNIWCILFAMSSLGSGDGKASV